MTRLFRLFLETKYLTGTRDFSIRLSGLASKPQGHLQPHLLQGNFFLFNVGSGDQTQVFLLTERSPQPESLSFSQ